MSDVIDFILYEEGDKVELANKTNPELYMNKYSFDITIEHVITKVQTIKDKYGSEYQVAKLSNHLIFPSNQLVPTDPDTLVEFNRLKEQATNKGFSKPKKVSKNAKPEPKKPVNAITIDKIPDKWKSTKVN